MVKEIFFYILTKRPKNDATGTLNEDYIGQQNVNTNRLCSLDLMLHWLYSNVYPKNDKKVSKQISELFDNFKYIKNWSRKARSDAYWSKYSTFRQSLEELLDIKAIDPIRIAEFVKKFRIKMDSDFYADQKKIPREGFCSSQVDRKWKISQMRANRTECTVKSTNLLEINQK